MQKFLFRIYLVFIFSTCLLSATTANDLFAKKGSLTIGIISAVPGESGRLLELMDAPVPQEKGKRTYYKGKLHGIDTVLVASRIGKVAAAATTTHLILEYNVDLIIFTGVAGAIDPSLNVGDVVIANALTQHDMDARPFISQYTIPLLNISELRPDSLLEDLASQASQQFIEKQIKDTVPLSILNEFNISQPKVVKGLVITGDQVISQESQKTELREKLPQALCVEMEGASVGQVCHEYGVPFAVIRVISDYANHQQIPFDIKKFVNQASGYYSVAIIGNLYALIQAE